MKSPRAAEHATFITHSPLFSGVAEGDCMAMADAACVKEYARHEFLFEQGEPLTRVVLILAGCVKLTQLSSDGDEVILWLRGAGDAVGVFGIPSNGRHTCSARVVVRCRVLSWDWGRMKRMPEWPRRCSTR